MTNSTTALDEAAEFDAGWGDGPDHDDLSADDNATHADDVDETPTPVAKRDAAPQPDSGANDRSLEQADLQQQLEQERQRYRSAEGRYEKFTDDINSMRETIQRLEQQLSQPKDSPPDDDAAPGDDAEDGSAYRNPQFAEEFDAELDAEMARRSQRARDDAIKQTQEAMKPFLESFEKAEADRLQAEEEARKEAFKAEVRAEFPEFDVLMANDSVVDELSTYIDSLESPALQRAYSLALDSGTPKEIAEMLNAFKTDTNWQAPQGESSVPRQESRQRDDRARRAAAAAAVPSRRSALPSDSADKSDFDAGWDLD